jgi:cytochrome P450
MGTVGGSESALARRAEPFIVETVGDVARPLAGLPVDADLTHLPGHTGFWAGIGNLIGMSRHGVAHVTQRAGAQPAVYRDRFGPIPYVAINDPDEVAAIARNADGTWSAALAWRFFFEGVVRGSAPYDFPLALDFEPHKDLRRLMQPAFKASAMASYVDTANTMFGATMDQWVARGQVSFKSDVRRLFANVAGRIFMGIDDPAEAEFLDRAMTDFWCAPMAIAKNPWLSAKWRRALRGYASLFAAMRALVNERRAGDGTDLLSQMCQSNEKVEWLDDDALIRAFLGLMAAAFDTTSMAVTSMAYALAVHPEWQERLREECKQLDSLTYGDIKKLPELDWAWKETLRLYPVANALPRRPLHDVTICGETIPAGAFVIAMLSPSMRDPKIWTEPERFDPERFSPDRAEDSGNRGAFLPFGAGAHACIGSRLSTSEAVAFWHAMLTRCRFRLAKPYQARHQFTPLGVVTGNVDLILEPL